MNLLHPLPNNRILEQLKLKAFAGDKINVGQKRHFVFGTIEIIALKGENTSYQHFLHFPQCFQNFFFFSQGCLKSGLCGKWLTHSHTVTPFDAPGKQAF